MTDKQQGADMPDEIWIEQGCSTFQTRDHSQDFGKPYYKYIRADQTAPETVEGLKREGITHDKRLRCSNPVAFIEGWNACLDHLTANGFKIIKEGADDAN